MAKHISNATLICILMMGTAAYGQLSPLEWSMKVADKVLEDASFDYFLYPQGSVPLPQTIDTRNLPHSGVYYAWSQISAKPGHNTIMGISSTSAVKIWLNGQLIYHQNESGDNQFKEVAYGIFEFPEIVNLHLSGEVNNILIKVPGGKNSRIHLGMIKDDGLRDTEVSFNLVGAVRHTESSAWLLCGPWENPPGSMAAMEYAYPPEEGFRPYYVVSGDFMSWFLPSRHIFVGHEVSDQAAFQRHPYTEWHYANGATMWSILRLAEASNNKNYEDFVQRFCEFTLEGHDYFAHQYHEMNGFAGHNMRIFRMSMLDDSSAPALPFISLYGMGKLDKAWPLIEKAAHQASVLQSRLPDNTLCRPEPQRWSIWADDLFMYLPFILQYAKLTGKGELIDDAIHQALMFHHYLFDETKGLYYHGWFSQTESHSVANWSRANGWIAWAMSELLLHIPSTHPQYQELINIHRTHMDGLIKYQHSSGLWNQVLDYPDTYLETSGSALFTIAMARGVAAGYLPEEFRHTAWKAWQGVVTRIREDGTVTGICQGTGIGETIEFYQNRQTPLHDPRGLGAVITAGIEIDKLFR